MKKSLYILFSLSCLAMEGMSQRETEKVLLVEPDTLKNIKTNKLKFLGQLSSWLNYNHSNDLPLWLGTRYIPQLNYSIPLKAKRLIDFEGSVNINGTVGIHPFDSANADGNLSAYRLWARYSTNQFELRGGLQKINFGSASLLRPLMWFDQADPRDPLQLTNGVWGVLARYYFLNNANLWVWGLYGNKGPKTWEIGKTSQKFPELGGRFQTPVSKGEIGLTYHFRMTDTSGLNISRPASAIAENRIGLDGKWDLGIGLWFEGAWIHKNKSVGEYINQEILNAGMDYTFDVGNGLNFIFENLLVSNDAKAFAFSNTLLFSCFSLSYPVGLFDNVSSIVYYNWTNKNLYNFVNWKKQFNKIYLYLMAYWNPKGSQLPQQEAAGNIFSGRGIQIMMVYNH